MTKKDKIIRAAKQQICPKCILRHFNHVHPGGCPHLGKVTVSKASREVVCPEFRPGSKDSG